MSQHVVTRRALAAAFAEWDRRYRERPDDFDREWAAASATDEYGDRAASYILSILRSQGGVASLPPDTTTYPSDPTPLRRT